MYEDPQHTYSGQSPQWPAPPPPAPRRTSAWWRSLWFVALVAAVIGIGIGAVSAGSSAKSKAKPGPTVTAVQTETTTATATVTVTATPTVIKTVATRVEVRRVTYTPPPPKSYGDGTYVVGVDLKPGTYHANAGQGYCAWFTAKDKSGTDLIDAGNTSGNGPLTVVVTQNIGSVVFQGDCTFHRV
jgi:heme/copper-type cytochrome/quinol oxidase subunit 2